MAPLLEPILVLGLGNPGPKYESTRHNYGAMAVRLLADRAGVALSSGGLMTRRFKALWGKGRVAASQTILALPQTYMNRSGDSAAAICSYFHMEPGQVITVHDDLDLEAGRLKIARKGGAGGHKGIRSIMQSLGSERFVRLKMGIGRPRYNEAIEKYVLEGAYSDQRELIKQMVETAADCLEEIIAQGVDSAMQKFHRQNH
jgi:PTH1 family peptidyl-tRNA hydrolase